jgi:hypothetical protein
VKNVIGTSTTEFLLSTFSGVNVIVIDSAEINVTPLKSLQVLFRPFKGKSSKNISMANIPILYKYLKQKKVGGCLELKPILATFEAIISANTMPYAKRF